MSRTRAGRGAVRLLLATVLGAVLGPLSPGAVSPTTPGGIGVAAFEQTAPAEIEVPDVAEMLAQRLAARAQVPVLGPRQLGGSVGWDASPEQLAAWGVRAGVAAVVGGRVTRLGAVTSLDVRLRATAGGEALGTFVEEAPDPAGLEAAVDRLAERILAALPGTPPVASGAPATVVAASAPAAAPKDTPAAAPAARTPVRLRSDAPISIRSDELEVLQDGERRRLLFTRNVRVAQDDVTLRAERLEAFYAAGSSQPERLVARGGVEVSQREPARSMRCDEATYFQSEQRVLCGGNAELRQGSDRVTGNRIEIFLDSGRLRVSGNAAVNFRPAAADSKGSR